MNPLVKIALCASALTAATLADAAGLGRLFFTPEQRTQLDYDYAREVQPDSDNRRTISVTGIVQRHGGERTIWINGVPQQVGKSDDNSPESATIAVPGQTRKIRAKVGQKVIVNPSAPER